MAIPARLWTSSLQRTQLTARHIKGKVSPCYLLPPPVSLSFPVWTRHHFIRETQRKNGASVFSLVHWVCPCSHTETSRALVYLCVRVCRHGRWSCKMVTPSSKWKSGSSKTSMKFTRALAMAWREFYGDLQAALSSFFPYFSFLPVDIRVIVVFKTMSFALFSPSLSCSFHRNIGKPITLAHAHTYTPVYSNQHRYEEIQSQFGAEAACRKADKLSYRYPRGESYLDVIQRLEPLVRFCFHLHACLCFLCAR